MSLVNLKHKMIKPPNQIPKWLIFMTGSQTLIEFTSDSRTLHLNYSHYAYDTNWMINQKTMSLPFDRISNIIY